MIRVFLALGMVQVVAVGIGVARSKLLAVLLGPEGVGAVSVVERSALLVVQLFALSLPFAAVRFLSQSHSRGEGAFRDTYLTLWRTLWLLTASGTVLALGVVLLWPEALGQDLQPYRHLLVPALLAVPAIAIHSFFVNVLAAARQARASAALLLFLAIGALLGVVVGVPLGGVEGYFWASLVSHYTIVFGVALFLRRNLRLPILSRGHGLRAEIRSNPEIVTFSAVLFACNYAFSLSHFVVRYQALSALGATAVGLLQAAIGVSTSLGLFLSAANGLYLTPFVNRDVPTKEKIAVALEFQHKLTALALAAAMPIVLFAPWMLVLLFSGRFVAIGPLLYLFVVAQVLSLWAGVHQALIIGLGDMRTYGSVVGLGQLSLGILAWLWIPGHGMAGAAASFVASGTLLFLATLVSLVWRHGMRPSRRLLTFMAYGCLALPTAGVASNALGLASLGVILGKGGFYLLFLASLLLFFPRRELVALAKPMRRLLARRGACTPPEA